LRRRGLDAGPTAPSERLNRARLSREGSKPKAETPSPVDRWTGAPASSGMVALAACFTELLHTRRVAASYAVFAVVFAAVV
jgi:hypothetical protein